MTVGNEAAPKGKKCHSKGKVKRGAGVAAVSTGLDVQPYMPMKLSSSRKAHLKTKGMGGQKLSCARRHTENDEAKGGLQQYAVEGSQL